LGVVIEDEGSAADARVRGAVRPPGTAPFLPDSWWELSLTMRRAIAGLALVLVVAVPVFFMSRSGSSADEDVSGGIEEATAFVAALSPQRVETWDSLAQCESTGNWAADTGNGFYGGVQFTLESWQTAGGTGNPAAASRAEQIMRAEMLQTEQGWNAWPNCAAELGLT
jgi:hypothetical protein